MHLTMPACAILLTTSLSAIAGDAVNETLEAGGAVNVTVRRGEVTLVGWDQPRVAVTGTRDDRSKEFIFRREGDSIQVEDRLPGNVHGGDGTNIVIHLPSTNEVRVNLVSSDLRLENTRGRLRARTVSGDVLAENIGGDATINTVSGDVIADHDGEELQIEVISGDVKATSSAREVAVKSVSGDVNVQCRQALQHGDVSSVSGDVQLRCAPSDGSDLRLASISGDVIFTLSGGNATIRADAGPSGDISLSLRGETLRRENRGQGRHETLDLRVGSGDADVRVTTISGDISLRGG
ncbi:MAG: DUF4097 family beta strand repeat protein [Pseudomonadales bacterium]|nr:DUF4097 family beta strand repeat protein [Pseudomonadales bacterium]MCP5185611.1 DUF4097 family beta strand repeat protein [Pseudomonadales bacterium]